MNLLELAALELKREGLDINNNALLLERAIAIRKFIDKRGAAMAERIMQGQTVYHCKNNRLVTYAKKI
jgi:hypothetical protein